MKRRMLGFKTLMALGVLFTLSRAERALAANGTWNGSADAFWTNRVNWASPAHPGDSFLDVATFANGSANTTVNLSGLLGISSIIFDSPGLASYTLGTGAANSQTLVLANSGTIQLTANAATGQTFNCAVELGHVTNNATCTFRNDTPNQTLTFSSVRAPAASVVNTRALNIEGVGPTRILGDIQKGSTVSLSLTVNSVGPLTLAGNNTLTSLGANGEPASTIYLAAGTNTFANGGGGNINVSKDTVIYGPGYLRLSDAGGENYSDNSAASGKILTIHAPVIGTGFEYYHGSNAGTIELLGTNTFTGQVLINSPGTISVKRIGNRGATDSNLGLGSYFRFSADGAGARLLYTGEGETTDRYLHFKKSLSIVEHGGSGLLTFSSTNLCDSGSKTLRLQGDTDGIGVFSGALLNSLGTHPLAG